VKTYRVDVSLFDRIVVEAESKEAAAEIATTIFQRTTPEIEHVAEISEVECKTL